MFVQYILMRNAVETSSARTGVFYFFTSYFSFMFHASFLVVPVQHSVRALVNYFQRSLCSSLSIKRWSLFLFYLFFSFSLVIVFLWKASEVQDLIKEESITNAPQENHCAGDIVTSCDLLSSHNVFFFADLFVR